MKWKETISKRLDHGVPKWAETMSFVVLALGAVSGALVHAGHVVGDGVDLYGTFWFYWWIGDCLTHFRNPSFTDLMFHPLGKDIFAHTGNNFIDAIVAQPFRWVLGFPRYQPVFIWFLLVGNALAFMPLAKMVCRTRVGAWTASTLWMVNPFTMFELMCGRLTQAFLWFMPLAIWQFLKIGGSINSTGWTRWRSPVLAGVMTALQGWTYWFAGYFLGLSLVFLAFFDCVQMVKKRQLGFRLILGWLVSGLCCAVCVAPAALMMVGLESDGLVPGIDNQTSSIFQPPAPGLRNNVSGVHGYFHMELLGQPMLAYWVWGGAIFGLVIWGRKAWVWLALAAVSWLFSIGAQIPRDLYGNLYETVGPFVLANTWAPLLGLGPASIEPAGLVMPHYMAAYIHLPYFDRLWFSYRILVITFLGLSLGLGVLVDRMAQYRRSASVAAGIILVAATLIEQGRNLAYPLLHREFEPPEVYEWIGETGGGLIELPMRMSRISIAWQAVHEQPTFGGMAENAEIFWPDGYEERVRKPFARQLRLLTMNPEHFKCCESSKAQAGIEALLEDGFRWIVLDRHLVDSSLRNTPFGRGADADQMLDGVFAMQDLLIGALGDPVAAEGPLLIWDLVGGETPPEHLVPTEEDLHTRTWPMDDMPAYEAHHNKIH